MFSTQCTETLRLFALQQRPHSYDIPECLAVVGAALSVQGDGQKRALFDMGIFTFGVVAIRAVMLLRVHQRDYNLAVLPHLGAWHVFDSTGSCFWKHAGRLRYTQYNEPIFGQQKFMLFCFCIIRDICRAQHGTELKRANY